MRGLVSQLNIRLRVEVLWTNRLYILMIRYLTMKMMSRKLMMRMMIVTKKIVSIITLLKVILLNKTSI
jgi:hypothetical protein